MSCRVDETREAYLRYLHFSGQMKVQIFDLVGSRLAGTKYIYYIVRMITSGL